MKYEQLFSDNTQSSIDAKQLEAYARYWYARASDCGLIPIEEAVAQYGPGECTAVNLLLALLGSAREELGKGQHTLAACCEELASWGLRYENYFGCQVLESHDGHRTVEWSLSDDTVWVSLQEVLQAMQSEGEIPEWWDEDMTNYEIFTHSGYRYVLAHDLSSDDPRHPDYEDEQQDEFIA
ncbi:hypothetical protein NK8_05080 [Caballeronia sp. NK8]|uniref:hypothetical protein n=1 Tax=Caballeronia sp. NK8 TaxID=140098 RepID=UPI001BB6E9BE|nr:hypothetical protein [Caballeronia sp. NK8]BCQ22399.1 hypothetical protein NK8_05080 [Caballeronia sp. NK8]